MSTQLLKPVVSEKSLALAETQQTYVFLAPAKLSKVAIGQAVARQFKVKVSGVNVINLKGKPKSTQVKRGRQQIKGERSDLRKAYVKLAKGESIQLFEEPKESKKQKA